MPELDPEFYKVSDIFCPNETEVSNWSKIAFDITSLGDKNVLKVVHLVNEW